MSDGVHIQMFFLDRAPVSSKGNGYAEAAAAAAAAAAGAAGSFGEHVRT